ncbi:Protein of unknown function (DUF2971) [Celeribacter persicus]|uniref:DUF2971 family protein n=1 Tax=Celeribacter persicus TaxID=1651082 RepID=A0A2T5HS28_9RHOB|nr:Protein of unknown function (DUF2971) [Celeribacter persicus]
MSEPSELWHYTTFDSLTAILQSQSLLATDFRALNDTQEFKYGINVLKEIFAREGFAPSDHFEKVEDVLSDLETRCNGQIISLSEARDSLSMWRGYGGAVGGNQAVAIVFNVEDLKTLAQEHLENKLSHFSDPQRVRYDASFLPQLNGTDVRTKLAEGGHMSVVCQVDDWIKLSKNDAFREEKEYRLLCRGGIVSIDRFRQSYQVVNGEFRKIFRLSFDDEKIFMKLKKPLAIKELWAGPKMNFDKLERYAENYFFQFGCGRPDIKQSRIPFI